MGFTLPEAIDFARDVFESNEQPVRIPMVILVTRSEDQTYNTLAYIQPALVNAKGETNFSIDFPFVVEALREAWGEVHNAQGVVTAFDMWSYPQSVIDEIRPQIESLTDLVDPASREWAVNQILDSAGVLGKRPSDFPEDERSEVSMFFALGDNGDFEAASQPRGRNDLMYRYDPFNENVFFSGSFEAMGDQLRKIVKP